MVSSWIFHDINSTNEILPTFAGYGNNYNICNVQHMHEGGLKMGIPWGVTFLVVIPKDGFVQVCLILVAQRTKQVSNHCYIDVTYLAT
jgi:hypothetical protein